MIFNYHPVVGLIYSTSQNEIVLMDLAHLEKWQIDEFIEQWKEWQSKVGITIVDSYDETEDVFFPIYSNVPYFE